MEIGRLDLVARSVVDGLLQGAHRTDQPGFSQEFAEYRDYFPGDDLRFVDWNAYARTDRLYLKRFEGETNTRLLLVLDISASMGVGDENPGKLRYGTWLAAALSYIAGRQHDAVGLLTFNDDVRDDLRPAAGMAHQQRLFHRLGSLAASGASDWELAIAGVAQRLRRRAIVALISDCWCEPAVLGHALATLGAKGHDVIVFHVLDQAERAPQGSSPATGRLGMTMPSTVRLRDVETAQEIDVDRHDLRTGYGKRLAAHEAAMRQQVSGVGAHYVRMNADEPLNRGLADYLRFRARHP